MSKMKLLRLTSAALVLGGGLALGPAPATASGGWEECDCFENYAFWGDAVNDCEGANQCVIYFSCTKHPIFESGGWFYNAVWHCDGQAPCNHEDPEFCA